MGFLKNRNYFLLLMGNVVSRLGTVIFNVVLSWWLTTKTGSSVAIGYVLAFSSVGSIIMMPFGGVLADKVKKRNILVLSDIVSGLCAIVIAFFVKNNNDRIWIYILGSFIMGISSGAFKPAIKSIMPFICEEKEIIKSNSLMNNLGEVTNIIGPSLSGLLLLFFAEGTFWAILFDGISFLISASSEVFIIYKEEYVGTKNKTNFWHSFVEGLREVKENRFIWGSIIFVAMVNFCLSSFNVLIPAYVLNELKASETVYSNLLTAYAVGGVLMSGIMIVAKFEKAIFKKLCLSVVIIGLTLVVLGASYSVIIAFAIVVIMGMCEAFFSTTFFSLLQIKINKEYLGRVFSIVFTVSLLLTPVANIFYGYIGEAFLMASLIISGIVVIVLSAIYFKQYNEVVDKNDEDICISA